MEFMKLATFMKLMKIGGEMMDVHEIREFVPDTLAQLCNNFV